MLVSIVTLNYKKSGLTIACMRSLYKHFEKEFAGHIMELIIVDNASGDDSVHQLREEMRTGKYTGVRLIESLKNAGFGSGCNSGASKSTGTYILFLNNDTLVQDKSILRMAEYMNTHSEIAILGGQLQNPDGTLQDSADNFLTLGNAVRLLYGSAFSDSFKKHVSGVTRVDWVKGALLMIRKDVFKKLGGFDENIFMYGEDMELCYRAKLEGHKTYFYPDVHIIHAEHGSANRTFAIVNIYKNLVYFYKKHRPAREYYALRFLLWVKAACLIILGILTRNRYLLETYKKAIAQI